MSKDLEAVSTYYLLLELLNDGEAGLIPEIEPLSDLLIIGELQARTGMAFGNQKDDWATWFVGNTEYGSELERANLLIFIKTRDAMLRISEKIGLDKRDDNNGG